MFNISGKFMLKKVQAVQMHYKNFRLLDYKYCEVDITVEAMLLDYDPLTNNENNPYLNSILRSDSDRD